MSLHAFVAMPFGKKEDIDFDRVYVEVIRPALEAAEFTVFRADQELQAGNIRTDMFQELLASDLVVADLSIDNPNVWYELGVRHALRARGVVQIQGKRDYMPFDVYVDRTLRYHLKDGVPDREHLEADRALLTRVALDTMNSWYGRRISPVYHLLRNLQEPEWKSLRVDQASEFWEMQDAWARRIELVRKANQPGDIVLLASEAPTRHLTREARLTASRALRSLGRFQLALDQCEEALRIDPQHLEARHLKGLLLGRLKNHDAAREWLEAVAREHPRDAETLGCLARAEKDAWLDSWRQAGVDPEDMKANARYESSLLREAIERYRRGFLMEPRLYNLGINAATLMHLLQHLTGDASLDHERQQVAGGVRWAALSALSRDSRDYWARVTLAELEVLAGTPPAVERAYKEAVAVANKDWFNLDSSRQQLLMFRDLGFRTAEVDVACRVLDRALARLAPPASRSEPRYVALFSGHTIDPPGRDEPVFPAGKEPIAADAIRSLVKRLALDERDLAICGGACGGDLLFAEICVAHGVRVKIFLPLEEARFLQESVNYAGAGWRERYHALKESPLVTVHITPDDLGLAPRGVNAFARNNLRQLHAALTWGPERIRFVCLWNGKEGRGPGGTKHMHDTVIRYSGHVYHLDTTVLWDTRQ